MKLCLFLLPAFVALTLGNALPNTNSRLFFRSLNQEPPPPPADPTRDNSRFLRQGIIQQKLDHFDDSNDTLWQMRFLANSAFYQPGGPIFIMVGGEWEISAGWIQGGHMYDMAQQMSGYLFYTEHRFYGYSRPTRDASTENMRNYLSVDQALADLAHFIDVQRATLEGAENAGVILVGASYAASMVTWFRQRYPDKANGVWSSSAPLQAKVDFYEYKEVVFYAMGLMGGEQCSARIEAAFKQIEIEVASRDTSRISTAFGLCTPLDPDHQLNVWNFFRALSDEFSWVVQGHWPGDIEGACEALTDASISDPVEALGQWVRSRSEPWCYSVGHDDYVNWFLDPTWDSVSTSGGTRQWLFQTCNEYGFYQTSSGSEHGFGTMFPVDWYVQVCLDLFGEEFYLESIQRSAEGVNAVHNGLELNVTNVFSTHGQIDPWRPLGVQVDINEASPTVVLEGYSHCQDLFSIGSYDTEQMVETKLRITDSVRMWLGLD